MRASLFVLPVVAALCAVWQPAHAAPGFPGLLLEAGSAFRYGPDSVELNGYKGFYQTMSDVGTSGYDGKPYKAEASGYALFKDGILSVSGASAVTGAEKAGVNASVLLTDKISIQTSDSSELLIVNYSFAVQRKVSGTYSTSGADAASLISQFSAWHGFGDSGLALNTENRWDAASNSLSDVSIVNYIPGVAVGVFSLSARINSGQWTDLSLHLSDSAWVNAPVASVPGYGRNGNVGTMSFSSSLFWGGISSVTRLDGSAIDFSVSSSSGIDYSQSYIPTPVPEPSTYALMGAGVALLAWRAGKKRRSR